MQTRNVGLSVRELGIFSVILGLLGVGFYWWTPMGIVFGLAGLVIGFVGWTYTRRHVPGFGLTVAGMLVSIAALILDFVVVGLDLEIIKLHAFR
jgi:ABC-type xylose transport system permease subunit